MTPSRDEFLEEAERYVGLEADTNVKHIEIIEEDSSWFGDDFIASATIADDEEPECWVIGGTTPMNLYAKSQFDNPDEAFSFHLGTIGRVIEQEMKENAGGGPDQVQYDAFICHAGEDKTEFVRPLAEELTKKGLNVWYDEFELNVGDSLRESIDQGLSKSVYGVVILSESFFGKEWTRYELNGLTARETQGDKVILPVWYDIGKEKIVERSPTLADKVAIKADGNHIEKTAQELYEAIMQDAFGRLSNDSDVNTSTGNLDIISREDNSTSFDSHTPPSPVLTDEEQALQDDMIRRDYRSFFENPLVHVVLRQPMVNGPAEDWDADAETVQKVWKISKDDGFYKRRNKSWKLTPKAVDRAEAIGEDILLNEGIQEEILDLLLGKYRENPTRPIINRDTLIDALDCSENEIDHNVWLLKEKRYIDTQGYLGDSRGYREVEISQLGRQVTE